MSTPFDFDAMITLTLNLESPDDPTFERALEEAVALVRRGEEGVLESLENAIINLSGDEEYVPYKPGFVMAVGADSAEARITLLELAAQKEFLKRPQATQKLIAAFKFLTDSRDFKRLIDDVYRVGGSAQAHALLLLNMQLWCAVQLNAKRKPT
jgi:hypothetical protein